MAKGTGLIGNFKGKVGNTVGYKLTASNNGLTQGIRVYQPIVKNPKTSAQAEQRAKLAPINATYRALKLIIDRGQESKAYGNKSRLAWLSTAMKAFNGGWFEKSATVNAPAIVPLTRGSLGLINNYDDGLSSPNINVDGITAAATTTLGALSTALIAAYPFLKDGDQMTFVAVRYNENSIDASFDSIVLDTTSTSAIPSFLEIEDGSLRWFVSGVVCIAFSVIVSRQGDGGQHLRSTSSLIALPDYPEGTMGETAKAAAIKSYMAGSTYSDWAEESIQ